MFSANVDAADLSDIQKLTYLREHLSGAAKETIAGLHLSSSNYHVAQELLRERFGDKQIRINAHHAALMNLPCALDSTASLRGLHDAIEMHLRSLKALGENIDSAFFVSLLTGKLPRQTMVQMEMQIGGQAWTPSLFRTTLSNLIRAQESADRLTSQHSYAYKSTRDQPSPSSSSTEGSESIARDPPTHTSATSPSFFTQALTTHATSGSSCTVSCAFCRGDHFSDVCTKFKTVEDRKKAAGSRCFRCLRRGHSASDCRATKKCFYCGRDTHHSSFCPKQFSNSAPPPPQATIAAAPTNVDAVATLVGENQAVVMQTALVEVIHTDGSTHHARILFDTGSSRSFVTESLQRRANLKSTGQDQISLATFGSPVRSTSQYPRVKLQIKANNGSVQTLSANVIPEITSPIQKVPLDVKKHPSLATLPLAEPLTSFSSDRLQVDILIGLDHYYDIIGADRMSFPDGLQLLHSTVGLVATGKVTSTSESSVIESSINTCIMFNNLPMPYPDFGHCHKGSSELFRTPMDTKQDTQPSQLKQQYQQQENGQPSQEQKENRKERKHKEVSQSPSGSAGMLQQSRLSPRQERRWQTPVSCGRPSNDTEPSPSSLGKIPWSSMFMDSSPMDDRDHFAARPPSSFQSADYMSKSLFTSSSHPGKTTLGGQYVAHQPLEAKRQHAASPTSPPQHLPAKQRYRPP